MSIMETAAPTTNSYHSKNKFASHRLAALTCTGRTEERPSSDRAPREGGIVMIKTDVAVTAFLCPAPEVRTMAPSGTPGAGEKSVHRPMTVDNMQGSDGWSPPS